MPIDHGQLMAVAKRLARPTFGRGRLRPVAQGARVPRPDQLALAAVRA